MSNRGNSVGRRLKVTILVVRAVRVVVMMVMVVLQVVVLAMLVMLAVVDVIIDAGSNRHHCHHPTICDTVNPL